MALDRPRVDQHLFNAEVRELRLIDVGLVVQLDADFVDDLIASLFSDIRADKPRLAAMDVMPAEYLLDRLDAGLDGRLVVGGAILPQKVLQDV